MKEIITSFYQSFADLDAEGMIQHYHPEVTFYDPAFGQLTGKVACAMWRMLCKSQKGKDFSVITSQATDNSIHWEAFYTFSKTKRKVHNSIDATFEFRDGKIYKHTDSFNIYRWAQQAFGFKGFLLGWTPFFRKKLRAQTHGLLHDFINQSS